MKARIIVDFNDLEDDDQIHALVGYADGPVTPGGRVVLYDGDGNGCEAVVTAIDGTLITLTLIWDTWSSPMSRERRFD